MFGKKKAPPPKPKSGKGAQLAAQLGLGGELDDDVGMMMDDGDDDASLEAELAALMGGGGAAKPKAKKTPALDMSAVAQMENYGEIGDDEDLSGDEDELLAELNDMVEDSDEEDSTPSAPNSGHSVVNLLQERLSMYDAAAQNAKTAGESGKVKRYERSIKSLQDLMKKAQSGRPVDEDEIPPAVHVGKPAAVPPSTPQSQAPVPMPAPAAIPSHPQPTVPSPSRVPAPSEPSPPKPQSSSADPQKHDMLVSRRDQYKHAALEAKHAGDMATAKSHVRVAKQFDSVIKALEEGKEIDLSQMPLPPSSVAKASPSPPKVERSSAQASNDVPADLPEFSNEELKEKFGAPDSPKTVLEALEQRISKYQQTMKSSEGSKARRYGRIVKQYQDAIKAHKAGKPVDYEELPTPPGFPPIPVQSKPAAAPVRSAAAPPEGVAAAGRGGQATGRGGQAPPQRSPGGQKPAMQRSPQGQSIKKPTSLHEQQEQFLLQRQNQFKAAALQAKNQGDREQAKTYLRMAKGFDQMIQAARGGLPVDLSKCPAPPGGSSESSTVIVADSSDDLSDRDGMYKKLEDTLKRQINTCKTNSKHFIQSGDVASSTKFEKMAENCRKDLDALANAYKHGDPVPRFHYELRSFSMMQSNADLGDSDMELVIVRGIQYGLPSGYNPNDMDTYVKYELPYPNDEPQTSETHTVKNTNSPDYNETFRLEISRKARTFARVVKSKTLKAEVFYKRGFLKSDKLLGTVNLKLDGLDRQCTVHESLDLQEGRKAVGGKLELKLRIREPLTAKQVEEVKEKWLVIDNFERRPSPQVLKAPAARPVQRERSPVRNSQTMKSLKVLNFERQLLEKEITNLKGKITPQQLSLLNKNAHSIQQQIVSQEAAIKQGGLPVMKTYIRSLGASLGLYVQEAQNLQARGYKDKAQLTMQKKKLVETEYQQLRGKYGV